MKHERLFHAERAQYLDDPERPRYLPYDAVIARIGATAGMHVADIGAGTGYFSFPLARAVGDTGKVYAVDLQKAMLEWLDKKRAGAPEASRIVTMEGDASRTGLPDRSVDLVLMSNVWHEVDDRTATLDEIKRILRPGGHFAILDWRPDKSPPPGPPAEHRVPVELVIRTLGTLGWNTGYPDLIGDYSYIVLATPPEDVEEK